MNRSPFFATVAASTVLIAAGFLAGCSTSTTETTTPPRDAPTTSGVVTVQILVDGKDQQFQVADVAKGTTVADVMRRIEGLETEIFGDGEMKFMNSIDGKATGGSEGWTYTVDGQFAEVGIGAMKLDPPTTVTWTYGDFDSTAAAE